MKRIIVFTLLLILLFPLYNALSEQVSFNFTYYMALHYNLWVENEGKPKK